MIVLEIALGIVLAVVILAFWPAILGLGIILLAGAIALIAAGLVILWAVKDSGSLGIVVAVVGGIFLIVWRQVLSPVTTSRIAAPYTAAGSAATRVFDFAPAALAR